VSPPVVTGAPPRKADTSLAGALHHVALPINFNQLL
jgi:hypothetical protein